MKKILLVIFVSILGFITHGQAQNTLTYNTATNLGWFTDDAWIGPATWTDGDSAIFSSAVTVTVDGTTTIGGLTLNSASTTVTLTNPTPATLNFSGGTIDVGTNSASQFSIDAGFSIQGDYTKIGNGALSLATSTEAYNGTATINGGRVQVGTSAAVGSNSNFIIDAGVFQLRNNNPYNVGEITINGGTFELGRTNANITTTANVTQLSGSGGNIQAVARNASNPATSNLTLILNQAANTTFAGNINGYGTGTGTDVAFLIFDKQGEGSLTLSGSIDLRRITTVSAGTLLINSSNATFTNGLGTTAIAVNATLGGTGTLEITNGDNVVLGTNGRLQAGLAGSAGQTTFDFSSGGVLNLSDATASANTGWLLFDLGAATTSGTTYDTIALTGTGSLNIGTGLNFSDFNFNLLSGFGAGTYTLFSTTAPITGSFGTTTGTLGGFEATLSFSGNNLLLTVIPEPSAGVLFLSSLATVFLLRRMRRRS